MPEVDPVILQLKADVERYNRDVADAARHTDTKLGLIEGRGKKMADGLSKGFSLAKTAAVSFAASLGVDAIIGAITRGLEYASSLGEVATQLGVTTNALQEYRYAASQAGIEQGEMDQALSQLTRRIGEAASGTKAQAKAFETLGIKVKDANGHVIDAGDALPKIAEAMQRIESPAERAALLMDLFGRAGQKLEPLLEGGAAGVNALRDAAHKLGVVLSETQIQNADDTADKLSALKQVLEADIAGTVANNTDAILALARAFGTLADYTGMVIGRLTAFSKLNLSGKWEWLNGGEEPGAILARQEGRFGSFSARDIDESKLAKAGIPSPKAGTAMRKKGGPSLNLAGTGTGKKTKAGGSGPSGPSAADIARQFNAEMLSYDSQIRSAQASMAKTAEERAELELGGLLLAKKRMLADIDAEKKYSGPQKERLRAQVEELAFQEEARIQFEKKARIEREKASIAEAEYRAQSDVLQSQFDLADSQGERKRIALDMIDLELRYQRSLLEAITASETATEAEKKRAQIALDALTAVAANRRTSTDRQNETSAERYLRELNKSPEAINEAIDDIKIDGLEALNDGLVDAIMGAKSLGEVFKNVANQIIADLLRIAIQQAVIQPLAEALFGGSGSSGGGGGGGGGLFGSLLGQVFGMSFGRASGGPVQGGQMYRVNEGASPGRVEGFIPQGSGTIVPLGRMNAMTAGSQPSGIATVRVELSGDIDARIERVSGPVAVQVVRASAPALIDASAKETIARAGRPRL